MYQTEHLQTVLRAARLLLRRRPGALAISPTVILLGFTSFFTDISSEMISTILPLYLVFGLGLSPLAFGFIDGLYQGADALVRIAGGFLADRWRRHKEIASAGYGLSAIAKVGFLVAGGAWTAIAAVILLDRTGKGIRTAPRDALISLSSPPATLGLAFGVHRALDTAGAMIGPLLAFALLALAPGDYHTVFVVSFCVALLGLGVITLLVKGHDETAGDPGPTASIRAAAELLRLPRFRALTLVGVTLGLTTLSNGFLFLGFQRHLSIGIGFLPLLYVATALVTMLLSVPFGRLADHIGRGKVFLGGYGLLLITYGLLLIVGLPTLGVAVCVLLIGAYYAATDGVLMALAGAVLPTEVRASGLALVGAGTSMAGLLASVLFGALWTWAGIQAATLLFLVGLSVALLAAAFILSRTGIDAHEAAVTN